MGSETGILSEALDQAPAFKILMLTESEKWTTIKIKSSQVFIYKSSISNWNKEYQSLKENGSVYKLTYEEQQTHPEKLPLQNFHRVLTCKRVPEIY